MNKLNKSLIAALLVGSAVTPVLADQKQATESLVFEAVDYDALFGSEAKTVEVAALSSEDMKNTEGAWFRYAIGGLVGGVSSGINYGTSVQSKYRTTTGWALAIGSGTLGGVLGGSSWWSAPIWGAGITAGGSYTATTIGNLNNVQSR